MLDLRKDVFSRLVISAQKNESLNKHFKNVHFDSWSNFSPKEDNDSTIFEKTIDDTSAVTSPLTSAATSAPQPSNTQRAKSIIKSQPVEKIDEKVEKIISDPIREEIRLELEVAEELLKKIKDIDARNPKIPILEHTVARMKTMLEQKSYV